MKGFPNTKKNITLITFFFSIGLDGSFVTLLWLNFADTCNCQTASQAIAPWECSCHQPDVSGWLWRWNQELVSRVWVLYPVFGLGAIGPRPVCGVGPCSRYALYASVPSPPSFPSLIFLFFPLFFGIGIALPKSFTLFAVLPAAHAPASAVGGIGLRHLTLHTRHPLVQKEPCARHSWFFLKKKLYLKCWKTSFLVSDYCSQELNLFFTSVEWKYEAFGTNLQNCDAAIKKCLLTNYPPFVPALLLPCRHHFFGPLLGQRVT